METKIRKNVRDKNDFVISHVPITYLLIIQAPINLSFPMETKMTCLLKKKHPVTRYFVMDEF